jgi:hypothetical protein
MTLPGLLRMAGVFTLLAVGCFGISPVGAQEPAPAEPLSSRQEALVLRYQRFETTLLQLAEYLRQTDPDRAELLVRALGKSKETRIPDQLQAIAKLLASDQLGDAVDSQDTVVAQMQLVLTLLQSEDRQDELEREKDRIRGLIKGVERIIAKETDVRSATERRAPNDGLQSQQKQVADDTQKLLDKIAAQDAERQAQQSGGKGQPKDAGKPSEGDPSNPKPPGDKPEEKSSDPQPGDKPKESDAGKPDDPSKTDDPEQPKDGSKPDGKSPSQSGKPSPSSGKPQSSGKPPSPPSQSPSPSPPQSPPQDGPPMPPSDSGEQQPPQPGEKSQSQTPGRQELERAKQEMERAIKELEQKQPGKASDRQDQALAELHKAKERLEEILRQLREEEKELMLAALEARFRDMLARQLNVHNGTVGLASVPEDQRADKHRSRSIELARNQDEVALLAAKSLTLLKEEGSSVAFPEAVVQIRDDMLTSARRLERADVGELTQGIQRDILEALEEILEALQKELEKSKDKKQQQQQQQQQQQPQEQGLVDALAELKMLRSLQYRVNRRTKTLGRAVDGEQAEDAEIRQQLQQLSARQAKIQRTAADLAAGRNK